MSTSDYRGASAVPQTQNANQIQYSQAAQMNLFPKKEQAIILNVNENLKLEDYVTAVANIVEPKNIRFISRISNNRVSIYLSTVQQVEAITSLGNTINIKGVDVCIRRMITPAKRLILSNVCPSIPHFLLEDEIRKLGFKTASPLSFLKAGLSGEEYAHILSFRRQIYVLPDDDLQLPSSIVVQFEETSYRIFLAFDTLICFNCKAKGHIAKQCTETQQQRPTVPDSQAVTTLQDKHTTNIHLPAINPGNKNLAPVSGPSENFIDLLSANTSQYELKESSALKRPSTPSATSSIDHCLETPISEQEFKIPNANSSKIINHKKLKKSDSLESVPINEIMAPVEKVLSESPKTLLLGFQQISSFLENAKGCKDPLSLARTYTEDIPALLATLHEIYPHFTHRHMKARCTKIQKKIRRQLQQSNIPTDIDTGSDSESSTYSEIQLSQDDLHTSMEY